MPRPLFRAPLPSRLSRCAPDPIAARAAGLPDTRATGPLTMSTRPAMSSASTSQDTPAVSALLNETAIELGVGVRDADGDGDVDGDGDFDAEADGDGDGDFDDEPPDFFWFPVWWSTSEAALRVCSRSAWGSGR